MDDRGRLRGAEWRRRGAAATLVVLFLPCLLAGAALTIDAGALLAARAQLAAAADMGALAGAQDLDYAELAEGRVVILAAAAIEDAVAMAETNLASEPFILPETVRVIVTVCNVGTGGGGPGRCPVTGRTLEDPTVCVLVRAAVRLPFGPRAAPVTVGVHADASVVGRP